MRLTRLHLAAALATGAQLALPEASARHIGRVLRLQAGDALRVFDGRGNEFEAAIAAATRERVEVRIGTPVHNACESPLHITLLQGVARGDRMDLILQKATELGVAAIRPLLTARSTVKLGADGVARRHAHWEGVVVAACEQSGRAWLPQLATATPLARQLAPGDGELKLLLVPEQASASLPVLLERHAGAAQRGVRLLVGPEGGFDEAETAQAVEAGFLRCRLGPRVLRTETAGLAAIAALQVLAGDWR